MSNILTSNPLLLDTANTSTVVSSLVYRIIAIVWDPGTGAANGDQAILKNENGVVVWETTLVTGNLVPMPFTPSEPFTVDGLIMHTLTRGLLMVYYRP
jgi:hypothetical protein